MAVMMLLPVYRYASLISFFGIHSSRTTQAMWSLRCFVN